MQAQLPTGAMTLQFAAKQLLADGFESGPMKIFRQLRAMGMLEDGHASRQAIRMDWLYERHGSWSDSYDKYDYVRVFITRSGLAELERRLRASMPVIMPLQPLELGMSREPLGF